MKITIEIDPALIHPDHLEWFRDLLVDLGAGEHITVTTPPGAPDPLLGDILTAFDPGEAQLDVATVGERLAGQFPNIYGAWTTRDLTRHLRPFGLRPALLINPDGGGRRMSLCLADIARVASQHDRHHAGGCPPAGALEPGGQAVDVDDGPEALMSHVFDTFGPGDDQLPVHTVWERLTAAHPDAYAGWASRGLAVALKRRGVATRQITVHDADGVSLRRGYLRDDFEAAR